MNTVELPRRKALGKGLESLLPSVKASVDTAPPRPADGTPREIPVSEIDRSRTRQ